MATADILWPATGSTAVYSGGGLTNSAAVSADDGTYATCTVTAGTIAKGTAYGNWGFDALIPSGATISDVQYTYQYFVSVTSVVHPIARVKARISASDLANHDDNSQPTVATTVGPTSIFSDRSWVRADLLDGVFQFVLEARKGSAASQNFSFDFLEIAVTYSSSMHTQAITVTVTVTPNVVKSMTKSIVNTITVNHPFSALHAHLVSIVVSMTVNPSIKKSIGKLLSVTLTATPSLSTIFSGIPPPSLLFSKVAGVLGLTSKSRTSELLTPKDSGSLPIDPE
jgi:hypothetical protein